ncbi:hypothetical protein THIOKS12650023 [Thiocapsa sp. KS1]|nr:hypothetical protein THIOKS12650023 [Thiocapsa sp. KS1]
MLYQLSYMGNHTQLSTQWSG